MDNLSTAELWGVIGCDASTQQLYQKVVHLLGGRAGLVTARLCKNKTAFFSPSENWCLPAPSTLKPEEREFVVDSGASMHMISKKDFEFR